MLTFHTVDNLLLYRLQISAWRCLALLILSKIAGSSFLIQLSALGPREYLKKKKRGKERKKGGREKERKEREKGRKKKREERKREREAKRLFPKSTVLNPDYKLWSF